LTGALVGFLVGTLVGTGVGSGVGSHVGEIVGAVNGAFVKGHVDGLLSESLQVHSLIKSSNALTRELIAGIPGLAQPYPKETIPICVVVFARKTGPPESPWLNRAKHKMSKSVKGITYIYL
jgi:hypothetical protein